MFKKSILSPRFFFFVVASACLAQVGMFRPAICCANEPQALLAEIERARNEIDADQLPDLDQAEVEVVQAITAVEAYFRRSTDADNFAAWMRYLKLDPLKNAIEEEQSVAVRGRASLALLSRLRGVEVGLELTAMVALREAITRYVAALRYSDPKRGLASIEKQLDGLVDLLSKKGITKDSQKESPQNDDGTPPRALRTLSELSPADVARMESLIGGLSDANQASGLVSRVRSLYREPNLRVWVDGQTITDTIMRPVNTPQNVNDCILGTRLIGDSRVDGKVRGQLLPSEGSIRVLVRLDGLFSTSARGYRKPITLDTTGTGNVYAARQIAITERRVVLGETIATASLATQIHRINHPLKIVRRIAAKQAAEQKPQAEAISREKLRGQIYRQFDEQTAQVAQQRWPDLETTIQPWFRRLDLPVLTRTIGSTSDAVYAHATLQRPTGLAARNPPPALASIRSASGSGIDPGGYLATVQVHQSVLDNTITGVLAGETFTPEKIERLVKDLGFELPVRPTMPSMTSSSGGESAAESSEEGSVDERFAIDLEDFRPVFLEAGDQQLKIGLRGTRFAQGDREISRTLEVAATYRPVSSGDGTMWLLRDEQVELSFPGTRRLTIGQTAIKANMQRNFNELFPRELLHRAFPLPQTVGMPALAGRVLQVSAIDFTDGWITIAVR